MDLTETIVLGSGCFWCTEAVFRRARGVLSVLPGYAGGSTENPTYEEVSSDLTSHAEVVKVIFNPEHVSLEDLLSIFFASHDPTTLNAQGADRGTQYRSIILWTAEEQQPIIAEVLRKAQEALMEPVVTEVRPLKNFTPAEISHQQYYEKNPRALYCSIVIEPKLEKLRGILRR